MRSNLDKSRTLIPLKGWNWSSVMLRIDNYISNYFKIINNGKKS